MIKKIVSSEALYVSLFWIAYMFLCLHFYVERSTYADNSYYLFEIIQHKDFCIQYNRYSAVLTQWLPVLAVKCQLPLNMVMYAYSLSPVLLFLLLFLIIRYICQQKYIAYIFLFSLILTVHDSFFYVNDELNQSVGFLLVMTSILKAEKWNNAIRFSLILMLIFILQFAHLFLLLAALVLLVVSYMERRQAISLMSIVFVVLLILARATIFKTGRDGSSMDSLDWHVLTLRNIHSSPFALFTREMIWKYYLPAIVLIVLLCRNIQTKIWSKMALIFGVCGMYLLLVIFLIHGASAIYLDKYLAVLFLLLWSYIAFNLITISKNKNAIFGLILLVNLISFSSLYIEKTYSHRVEYLKVLMAKGTNKQIVLYENMPPDIQTMSWSVPYETLLISTLNGESKTILVKESFYKIEEYLTDSTAFLGAEWTFPQQTKLNEYYFTLKNGLYEYKP